MKDQETVKRVVWFYKTWGNAAPLGSSAATGYIPDLDKDISFLKEMRETFEKIQNGNGWDRMQMDHLGIMIQDWLTELEKAKGI